MFFFPIFVRWVIKDKYTTECIFKCLLFIVTTVTTKLKKSLHYLVVSVSAFSYIVGIQVTQGGLSFADVVN